MLPKNVTTLGNDDLDELCPLLELPCPQGKDNALECRRQVDWRFDPLANFGHLCILECAKERAERMRQAQY
jgi:hypothetical protein